jgi:hypothetical protein
VKLAGPGFGPPPRRLLHRQRDDVTAVAARHSELCTSLAATAAPLRLWHAGPLHVLPRIFRVVARLAAEYHIPYVRIVDDHGGTARSLAMSALSVLGRRARNPAFTNDRTVGVAIAGCLDDVVPLFEHVADSHRAGDTPGPRRHGLSRVGL